MGPLEATLKVSEALLKATRLSVDPICDGSL